MTDDAAVQELVRRSAGGVLNTTNITYFDFVDGQLVAVSIRYTASGEVRVVSSEGNDQCFVEELQNHRVASTLTKLMDVHLEEFELEESMSLHNFTFAAAPSKEPSMSFKEDGLAFSALPYGIAGPRRIAHRPREAQAPPSSGYSFFSRTRGEGDGVIHNCISYQFLKEFNWQVAAYLTDSQRHACPLFWHGQPPINVCPGRICNSEMVDPITGHPYYPDLALKRKVAELER